ncbi:putative spermidine/putrescine transport system permease protein [Kineococcus xinjiangensis]|uniref:Putative spermidine/putrescine transport system permease protein n=1 Tax=Kineococcus xinjiangensis TaxID=512762 RepID=A0A2S6IV47_9ACTN|nr:ABC transporter permease subunit [Kineococcus xinjiangensis]PPK98152.1 putative spermidine/putrescine transport system permease protein [Kineococcus xinjiangensis]
MLVAPALVPTVAVLVAGLAAALAQSLGLVPLVGRPELSAQAYLDVRPDLLTATGLSLGIAAASSALAAGVGLLTALLVVRGAAGRRLLRFASAVPIPVPHLVGAASMGLLLSDSGLLARLVGDQGSWPALVHGPWPVAVVAAYAWKESAFVALVVAGALATRVASYEETAAVLGAGRWARFRFVTWPLVTPPLAAATAITFVYTLGSYEVAWLLGPVHPEPLPVLAQRLFTSPDLTARPQALAVAVVTAALALAATVATLAALRRTATWR